MHKQYLKDYSHEISLEKEKSVFVQAPVSNITILVMSSIAFFLIYDKVNIQFLILWFVAMFLMAGLRLVIWIKHRLNPARFSTERWILIYTVTTGLLGLVWSSLYLFGYENSDPLVSFVVYMTFFGVLSAAASVLSVHLPLFIVYTYPQAIVFLLILILNVSESQVYLLFAVFVYMTMLTLFTRNTNKQFVNTVRLQSENASLIDGLNKEVEQREQLIDKRTRELVEMNEELGKEIHERKTAQEEAGFQVSLLNSVLNSTPDLISYKDYVNLDGCYIGCNDAFAKSCGLSVDGVIGQNDIELFGHEAGNYIRVKDQVTLHSVKTHPYQEWITYPDGHRVLLSTLRTPLYGYNQKLMGVLGVGRDITEMKNAEDQLKKSQLSLHHLAHHDALTGLPNRLLMIDRLQQAIKRTKRANEGLAIMFIDLDRFKEINDSLGHGIGDQLLKAVATRLKQQIRKEDTAARLGGDEFTIILEGLDNSEFSTVLAQKLLLSFNKPLNLGDREITMSLSIGISLFPDHGADPETLLKNADSAMYQAKKDGRNGYCLYTENLTQK